jgi:hypothetical protein
MRAHRRENTNPHPLEPAVLKAFEERSHHDGTSLGLYLAGSQPNRATAQTEKK